MISIFLAIQDAATFLQAIPQAPQLLVFASIVTLGVGRAITSGGSPVPAPAKSLNTENDLSGDFGFSKNQLRD